MPQRRGLLHAYAAERPENDCGTQRFGAESSTAADDLRSAGLIRSVPSHCAPNPDRSEVLRYHRAGHHTLPAASDRPLLHSSSRRTLLSPVCYVKKRYVLVSSVLLAQFVKPFRMRQECAPSGGREAPARYFCRNCRIGRRGVGFDCSGR